MTRGSLDQDAFMEVVQAGDIGACPECLHDYAVACPGARNPNSLQAWLSIHRFFPGLDCDTNERFLQSLGQRLRRPMSAGVVC